MADKKKPLIVIAGPTAAGKTKASIELAKYIGGEIISADSMQVYRMMDIGSAKIQPEEMQGVPHHLIDVLDPREEFNVTVFQQMAREAMEGIYSRGHVPILVGGTGFYIQAVTRDIDFTENGNDRTYRHALEKEAEEQGAEALHEKLRMVDPESADKIPVNNVKRTIRALEYFQETGRRISEHNAEEKAKESPYDLRYYVLTMDRARLYERIEKRVDLMMEAGLLEEVKRLKDHGCTPEMTSMQGLGYKQILMHLNGEITLEEAVERTKIETRHFAKRQLTWFRGTEGTISVDSEKEDLINVYQTGNFG